MFNVCGILKLYLHKNITKMGNNSEMKINIKRDTKITRKTIEENKDKNGFVIIKVSELENLKYLHAHYERKKTVTNINSQQQFDNLQQQLYNHQRQLDDHAKRLDAVEKRLDAVEKRLDAVEKRLDAVEKRLDIIEIKLDKQQKQLDNIEKILGRILNILEVMQKDIAEIKSLPTIAKELKEKRKTK